MLGLAGEDISGPAAISMALNCHDIYKFCYPAGPCWRETGAILALNPNPLLASLNLTEKPPTRTMLSNAKSRTKLTQKGRSLLPLSKP